MDILKQYKTMKKHQMKGDRMQAQIYYNVKAFLINHCNESENKSYFSFQRYSVQQETKTITLVWLDNSIKEQTETFTIDQINNFLNVHY